MASKSPLALVKETFGDKSKLVEAVEKLATDELWVARVNENKGLAHVSNAKLLRLHATFTAVKEKFGTRDKLIDALLELQHRAKDATFRQKLAAWPVPRLYDAYRSTAKRAGVSGAEAKPATVKAGTKAAPAEAKPKAAKKVAKKAKAAGSAKAGAASKKAAPAKKSGASKKSARS